MIFITWTLRSEAHNLLMAAHPNALLLEVALMKASLTALVLCLLVPAGIVACSASDDTSEESSESDLRAMTPAEIVGTIAYGETKTVAYTSSPKYRALSFQAEKGDAIDARFVGDGGVNPTAYLLSSTFSTLEHNDDEAAGSSASHFTHVISKAGTYYLVVRDVKTHSGNVTISLSRTNAAPNGPSDPNDPFDAASCSGSAITSSKLMAMLDPARGVLSKKVGRFTVHRRDRACYAGLACSDWRDGSRDITAPFQTLNATFSTAASAGSYQLNLVGDVSVSLVNNALRVSLDGDVHHASWGASLTPSFLDDALHLDVLSPTDASASGNVGVKYTWMPSLGCPNGHCEGNESIPGTSVGSWAGKSPLVLSGKVGASCLRLAASAQENVTDANGNAYRLESDIVFSGDFSSSTCQAKTCTEANSTCGTISDGCGGTLSCGTCSSSQTCQTATTGNSCRAMTAEEQCAASGRVYCPGHGGCWDACS